MPSVTELVKMRFAQLTQIQKKAIPLVLEGKNVLVVAPTGFGKTECALLPIFEGVQKQKPQGVFALYITPLKALNRDMLGRIEWWCEKLGISYSVRHGDTAQSARSAQLKNPPQILITTPETFGAILCAPKFSSHLANVRFVVVDEVHELMENKRGAQLAVSLERLEELIQEAKKETAVGEKIENAKSAGAAGAGSGTENEDAVHGVAGNVAIPSNFQRIGLSATLGDEGEAAKFLVGEKRGCEIARLDVARKMEVSVLAPDIEEWDEKKYRKKNAQEMVHNRVRELVKLIEGKKALIFANSRAVAEVLGARLIASGVNVLVHHGSLSKEARTTAEDEFRAGRVNALVCTSSLELGIDIGDIDLVVQYCSPKQAGRLLQRVGRSGHSAFKTPKGIVLCSDEEDRMEANAVVKLAHEGKIEREECEKGALDVAAQQLAGYLLWKKQAKLWEIQRVFSRAYTHGISMEKMREIAKQMGSQRIISYDEVAKSAAATFRTRQYYFSHLSTIPPSSKYFARNSISNARVCTLDEKFVAGIEEGDCFIVQGRSWRVVSIEEEKTEVLIEPAGRGELAVPSWEGEEIPVASGVAKLVGKEKKENASKFVRVCGIVPDGENFVVEATDEFAVMHCSIGTLANSALGKALGYMLSHKVRGNVHVVADAYRIMMQLPRPVSAAQIREMLLIMPPLQNIVRLSLANSALFRYKLTQACRMFGSIGERGRITKARASQLSEGVVYAEAMRSALRTYMDMQGAQEALAKISDGSVKVHTFEVEKLSYAALFGIETAYGSDFDAPLSTTSQAIEELREALMKKTVSFVCFNCRHAFVRVVGNLQGVVKCPKCEGSFVAIGGEVFRGKNVRVREEKDLEISASLISAYGMRAVYALSAYGVGVGAAASVLRKPARTEDEFFANILSAQRNFIKNRKYWKG
ncbi:ATP-dependent DNA helicase Hel308 [Candidatus Anstonella stagnisolia]|nr:ATP-dependent DNA helicase Hel308 [Candidatus Anstonella stagnisolia]